MKPALNVQLFLPVLSLREAKRQAIIAAVKISSGQIGDAAKLLDVHRSTISRLLRELNITTSDLGEEGNKD